MQAPFDFATATRIQFGTGVLDELPGQVKAMSKFVLLVTGSDPDRTAPVRDRLMAKDLVLTEAAVTREPTVGLVLDVLSQARQSGVGAVVAVGGGSVIDTGKAVAALLTNVDDLMDYLEVVGNGQPLENRSAPFVAIPTTAGTGSEVTRNAVMLSEEHGVKVSLRSPLMLPHLALIDPQLTVSMPKSVTASTGLDALTQVLEPFVSLNANPLTDSFCREGLYLVKQALLPAFEDGQDMEAREKMAMVSLLGGLALANAGLGAAHGFAGPIGGLYPDAPHGVICARVLPHVMEANVRALKERDPDSTQLERYREVARILTEDPEAKTVDGIIWVQEVCRALAIRPLAAFGLSEVGFEDVITRARRSSSMRANPIKLSREELTQVLTKAVTGA